MNNKLVILDRDGTINQDSDDYIKSPEEWIPLPGALEAIARLNHAGWQVVVASNQSGLGRGLFDMATLNAMHAKMNKLLTAVGGRVDAVFFCPHGPEDQCHCRKPLPGLFEQIGERLGIPIDQQPEDRHAVTRKLGAFKTSMLQDVEAGKSIGLDALVGAVRELGQLTQVATPFTDALLGLSRLHARVHGLYPAQSGHEFTK